MAAWLKRRTWTCDVCPAVPAVLWFGCGVLLALGPRSGLLGARLVAGVGAGALLWSVRPVRLRRLSLFMLLGVVLTVVHVRAPWRTYPALLPRQTCRVWLRGACVTPTNTSKGRYLCQIRSISTWADRAPQPCHGTVLVQFSPSFPVPEYGEIVEIDGTLHPPAPGAEGALFDYRRYLWNRGVVHVVEEESRTEMGVDGWRIVPRLVYELREGLSEALGCGIANEEHRGMLQAMVLGYRQRLPAEMRQDFVRSSTIHVFAISGLHVGIVAFLAGLALRPIRLNERTRGVLLILIVGGYVFMCGAAASAVRAWLMLSCWWGARLLRRPRVPLNAIASAALLCLLWSPLSLLRTGFLFSFAVVTVLVVGWPVVSDSMRVLGERRWWLPPRLRQHRLTRWRLRPLWALGTSSLAWLGSAGMTASINGLLVPAGIAINIGVIGLCTATVMLSAVKVLVSLAHPGFLETPLAWCLGALARGLHGLASLGELPGASLRVCPLAPLLAVLYYGLLAVALRRKLAPRWRSAALGAGLLVLLAPSVWHWRQPPGHRILAGDGSTMPGVLAVSAAGVPPVLVNTGGGRRAQALLEQQAIGRVEAIVFTSRGWDAVRGAGQLVARWSPRVLVVPPNWERSKTLSKAVRAHVAAGGRLRTWARDTSAVRCGDIRLSKAGTVAEQEIQLADGSGSVLLVRNSSSTGVLDVHMGDLSLATIRRRSDPVDLAIAVPDWADGDQD